MKMGQPHVKQLSIAMACSVLAVCLGLPQTASADVLAAWDFASNLSPSTEAPNIDAGDVVQGLGIPSNGGGRSGSGQNLFVRTNTAFNGPVVTNGDYTDPNNEASVIAADDYFEFTITPALGYQMSLDSFSFDYYAQDVDANKGPAPFFKSFVRSDVDSYATTLGSETLTNVYGTVAADTGDSATSNVVATLDSSFDALTGLATFRVYLTDGVNMGSDLLIHRVDNVQIDGTVSLIPEPASIALLGLAGVGLIGRRRR